ncbi:MAG: hypothetical protein ACKO04_10020 [Actinomycetes bacterium]
MHGLPLPHLPAVVLAEVGAGTLVRCLLIAVVVVTPYGLHQRAKVRRVRAEAAAARGEVVDEAPPPPDPLALETAVNLLEELGRTLDGDRTGEVLLPDAPTVDGRPAPAELVDMLVNDAVRLSGLQVVARHHDRLVVRPAGTGATG